MSRVVILEADNWEALYIDGGLIDQDHTLGEGDSRLFLLKKSEEYNFKSTDIEVIWSQETQAQVDYLEENGYFPQTLKEWEKI